MSDIAVTVQNVSKFYKLYDFPKDRLKEALHPFGRKYHKQFYALRDVSFDVKKGELLGILGKNGSGKSTLLKLIAGILVPSNGQVKVVGSISALLELGAGFNPNFTGIQNIYFYGSILGFSKEQMDAKLDPILEFADIGDFIHQPIKTYSSGMRARLAFAVATEIDPDILIIDEVLAVGDIRFNAKCMRKMHELINKDRTVLIVTHNPSTVAIFCEKALWLKDGNLVEIGNGKEIAERYRDYMLLGKVPESKKGKENKVLQSNNSVKSAEKSIEVLTAQFNDERQGETDIDDSSFMSKSSYGETQKSKNGNLKSQVVAVSDSEGVAQSEAYGSTALQWLDIAEFPSVQMGDVKITHVALIKEDGKSSAAFFARNEKIQLYVRAISTVDVDEISIGWVISDKNGLVACHCNSQFCTQKGLVLKEGEEYLCRFDLKVPPVRNGDYIFTFGIKRGDKVIFKVNDVLPFAVCTDDLNSDQGGYIIIEDAHFSCESYEL